jgi:hypothetical protein
MKSDEKVEGVMRYILRAPALAKIIQSLSTADN